MKAEEFEAVIKEVHEALMAFHNRLVRLEAYMMRNARKEKEFIKEKLKLVSDKKKE